MDRPGLEPGNPACKAGVLTNYTNSPIVHPLSVPKNLTKPSALCGGKWTWMERIVGLEPTLFHIGSVMPYQLGEIRMSRFFVNRLAQ